MSPPEMLVGNQSEGEAGFTPGRWEATPCGPLFPNRWNVISQLGVNEHGIGTIRTIDQVLDYCGPEEAAANARLIAASPTMYSYVAQRAAAGDPEAIKIVEAINASR